MREERLCVNRERRCLGRRHPELMTSQPEGFLQAGPRPDEVSTALQRLKWRARGGFGLATSASAVHTSNLRWLEATSSR